MDLRADFFSRLFVTFVCASGLAALVNLLCGVLFRQFVSYELSIVLAYPCGIVTAYLLNRLFVFGRGEHSQPVEVVYFVLINVFSIMLTYVVSVSMYQYILPALSMNWYRAEIAHFFGVASPALTSFIGHKYLTFRGAQSVVELERDLKAKSSRGD